MSKIICFGEIMLRLSPPGHLRFVQANSFGATYGGGEANVGVSLSNYGMDAVFATKVPDNSIGQAAINSLKQYSVNTNFIAKGGKRLGIYFLEKGSSQRPSKVIYDRADSSISTANEDDFDWDAIFEGAKWFHFTGITPALSENAQKLTHKACKKAKEKGLTVSCDLNYRKNLWSTEKAGQVMEQLMEYVDVCIANEEDAEKVFGIKADNTDITGGKLNREGYKEVAKKLKSKFDFDKVAITLRESLSASVNNWGAMLYAKDEFYFSKRYSINIVDRVGGGDSFAGGLIYSLMNEFDMQECIEFAVGASCLKHSIEGDFNHVTVDEVKSLIKGDGSGRVQR
ncbi:PfkB family carbohydrate kinase [Herbivorax sp. ANBcel31]|uniref:PfkB family carbohydrate kinase n=1 Tax=Herbivorax sp. ANBcel31 TaxID=3069754 RepID=UPI0035930976